MLMRRLPEALNDRRFSGPRIRDIVTNTFDQHHHVQDLEHDVLQLVPSSSSRRSLDIHYRLILNSSLAMYQK